MSAITDWDVELYKDEHESGEQWELRKAFMTRWKDDYSEQRLVCLARVFTNVEFMGCRYPNEVMEEISRLSVDVAETYRENKKGKLCRTFVSASDAAEDRARGVKRAGGVVEEAPRAKSAKINFVASGTQKQEAIVIDSDEGEDVAISEKPVEVIDISEDGSPERRSVKGSGGGHSVGEDSKSRGYAEILDELNSLPRAHPRCFTEDMFDTKYGRFVLLVRPWTPKLNNIHNSSNVCCVPYELKESPGQFSLRLGKKIIALASNCSKKDAKKILEDKAWEVLIKNCIVVVFKEGVVYKEDETIGSEQIVSRPKAKPDTPEQNVSKIDEQQFGTPVSSSIASKMMKMMGWKGGALGANSDGIEEPVMPHLQQVHRAGLGSDRTNLGSTEELRRNATALMRRYAADATALDLDLVFSSDFSKEERAMLHGIANRCRLVSRSYGKDDDRFLVVKKKMDPFALIRALIQEGGTTPKYEVFIPGSFSQSK